MKNELTLVKQARRKVAWDTEEVKEGEPEAKETATPAEAKFPLLVDPFHPVICKWHLTARETASILGLPERVYPPPQH